MGGSDRSAIYSDEGSALTGGSIGVPDGSSNVCTDLSHGGLAVMVALAVVTVVGPTSLP